MANAVEVIQMFHALPTEARDLAGELVHAHFVLQGPERQEAVAAVMLDVNKLPGDLSTKVLAAVTGLGGLGDQMAGALAKTIEQDLGFGRVSAPSTAAPATDKIEDVAAAAEAAHARLDAHDVTLQSLTDTVAAIVAGDFGKRPAEVPIPSGAGPVSDPPSSVEAKAPVDIEFPEGTDTPEGSKPS